MKREELRQWFVEWLDDYYDELHSEDDLTPEVAESVLTALRPVSREQVEKVWKGEWTQGGYACGEHEWECSKCHETEWRTSCSRLKFCPFCGAPMTDEAVQIVVERLEKMKDGSTTDKN